MTTLLQRCRNLDAKLADLTLAKLHVADVQNIQNRSEEWRKCKAKRIGVQSKARLLALAAEDEATVGAKRKSLRELAATVLSRVQGDEDINKITRDDVWLRLLRASDGFAEALEGAVRRAWSSYLEQRGSLEDPTTLRLRTPKTPQNEEALRMYLRNHALYADIAKRPLPATPEDLTQLDAHVAACKVAYKQITFDLPPDVRAFFDAFQSDSATLAHLTPQVLAWLAERKQLEFFRVRSARP